MVGDFLFWCWRREHLRGTFAGDFCLRGRGGM